MVAQRRGPQAQLANPGATFSGRLTRSSRSSDPQGSKGGKKKRRKKKTIKANKRRKRRRRHRHQCLMRISVGQRRYWFPINKTAAGGGGEETGLVLGGKNLGLAVRQIPWVRTLWGAVWNRETSRKRRGEKERARIRREAVWCTEYRWFRGWSRGGEEAWMMEKSVVRAEAGRKKSAYQAMRRPAVSELVTLR